MQTQQFNSSFLNVTKSGSSGMISSSHPAPKNFNEFILIWLKKSVNINVMNESSWSMKIIIMIEEQILQFHI